MHLAVRVCLCVGCTRCCPFPQTALPHSVTQPLMTVCYCLSSVASPALMTVSLPNHLAPAPSFGSHRATGLVAREMLTSSTHFLLGFCGGGVAAISPLSQPLGCSCGPGFQLAGGTPRREALGVGPDFFLGRDRLMMLSAAPPPKVHFTLEGNLTFFSHHRWC